MVKIQRWYRAIRQRRIEYQARLERAVIGVQSRWRMIAARRRFEVKLKAITAIQGWFRVKRAQRMLREMRRTRAAVAIQKQWRMLRARREYQAKVSEIKIK